MDWNGKFFNGGYYQSMYNGKREHQWADGSREIAYWVAQRREGAAKYYDKNGKEEDRFYENDKLVEK